MPGSAKSSSGMTTADVSTGLNPDTVVFCPAEPGRRLRLGTIFAADPARVAEFVEQIEQEGMVDLADIRLVAARVAGDLHMRVVAGERADAVREIAFHDLHMVEVELELEIGMRHPLDHRHRLGCRVEEIARDVAIVDRLVDDGDALGRGALGWG